MDKGQEQSGIVRTLFGYLFGGIYGSGMEHRWRMEPFPAVVGAGILRFPVRFPDSH